MSPLPLKSFAWVNKLFWAIFSGMFYMGTNHQIIQGGKLKVKRFQRSSQVIFSFYCPDLGYWYIIWKVKATNRRLNLKSTFWTSEVEEFHVKSVFFFFLITVVTCSLLSGLYGSFRFTCLWARLMEKWVKALHSESGGSWLKPRILMTLESNKYQTQWLRWWY